MKEEVIRKALLCLASLVLVFFCIRELQVRQPIEVASHLDAKVLTVDGEKLTLRDVAFYIAYQEKEIQKDALLYNAEHPKKFWNVHTNGHFIRVLAEDAVLAMAVHDEIFYRLAVADGTELNEEETIYLANEVADFCGDLTEEQFERLGVTPEELAASMEKIALANKYQSIYTQINGVEYSEYDYTTETYKAFLAEHKVTVNEKVWDRVTVGKVTVNYK